MLKGERVTLRAMERSDLAPLLELRRNHLDLLMLGQGDWQPESLAYKEKWFEKRLEGDQTSFVIEVDGKVVGDIGLYNQNRRDRTTEFGMAINDPDYVGRGYGREALNLFLGWVFKVQNFRRVVLQTFAVNERAIRAYRACGFVEEGRLRRQEALNGELTDVVIMGLLRDEWLAVQQGANDVTR